MNTQKLNVFSKKTLLEECKTFFSAAFITALVFGSTYAYDAYSANPEVETLTVTIAESVTFAVTTNVFGSLTPGTYKIATSTTDVLTNAPAWHLTLYGNDRATSNTVLDLTTDASIGITDQHEWVAGAATSSSSAYPAVIRTSLDNSNDVLAFRVMSASGTLAFRAPTWWGASDADGVALWTGIASSTVQQRIGASNVYSATNVINTVQYYLDVPTTQVAGDYDGQLTYTWVTGV
jgi:hypothetical protein